MSTNNISKLLKASFEEERLNLKELFNKKIAELGITDRQAHLLLSIDRNSLGPILNGTTKHPNMFNIMKISDFLEIPMEKVISTLLASQDPKKVRNLERVNELHFLTKYFDIERLKKVKFIETKTDTKEILNRILEFFGFNSIIEFEEYNENLSLTLFSKTRRKFIDKMRDFAIISANRMFESIDNPNDYDREELKNIISKFKPYSRDVNNGLLFVCRSLYNIGVTVLVQHHLTTSQYRGATFIVNNKPCIVLTDLNKNYATIWYALLHELYHVLFDYDQIEKQGYHLTGQPELFLINEESADDFAREYFFGEEMYNYIKPHIHNEYIVKMFAEENNIHHAFVYRGFQFFADQIDGENYWRAFRNKFPDIKRSIKGLSPLVWQKNLIAEKAKEIKNIFELNEI